MTITARTYSCNYETYKKVYKSAIKKIFEIENIEENVDSIVLISEELPGETIQAQRSVEKHTRTISIFFDEKLKYIVGLSNTNYDEDKKLELETKGGKYVYGEHNYHSNTYLFQGINKIFEYYYDQKNINDSVKLFFYLLDTEQTYANNLSNLMNYRKLATIGFRILNLEEVSFSEYKVLGFSIEENIKNIKYISFNKFANDLLYLSRKNTGNIPSYLKCIDENYDIGTEQDDDSDSFTSNNQKYIYTFKTLSAEGYDSFLTMWTLNELAKNENKNLEFLFASEIYHLQYGKDNYKYSKGFTGPIIRLIEKANLDIKYETSDEILHQLERENNQYETAKEKGVLRNQELFKNNMREKGLQTKCYLCGCEIETILEAAHIWGVAEIRKAPTEDINSLFQKNCFSELIMPNDKHSKEQFYKRYLLANSGDNGIWLCNNHHGLFDSNYYCFDSNDGKVLIKLTSRDEDKLFFNLITENEKLPREILSDRTKIYLEKRKEVFNGNEIGEEFKKSDYI